MRRYPYGELEILSNLMSASLIGRLGSSAFRLTVRLRA